MLLKRGKGQQRKLPGFEKFTLVKGRAKYPQPRLKNYHAPKKFELIYRPLDLNFRGQLNKWLISVGKEFDYRKLLNDKEKEIIKLYLFPQTRERKWLNQKQVMQKVVGNPNLNLKKTLTKAMLAIWSRRKKR